MMNTLQPTILKIRLAAASAALMFVVVLGSAVFTTHSAQAQTFTDHSAQAQTFTSLYSFTGGSDGGEPLEGLLRDKDGNLYGTTFQYGAGYGVVFKVTETGTESVLYSFTGGADGADPYPSLITDTAGNLYGTALAGGSSNCSGGCGVVFKVDKNGTETVLYSFKGGTTDGCGPGAPLIRDSAGNFYGTTGECGASGFGTVFKLPNGGKEKVLHSFAGTPSDGQYPYYGALLIDKEGNLYGVTDTGGASGDGTLFKLSKTGKETLLHSFAGGTDGDLVFGGPVADKDGNLYGTADLGGSSGAGIVWKVSKKGKETVLHTFAGGSSDGANPIAGVILDAKGNLYGQTQGGGASGDGTVYELSTKGKITLLHSFDGSDGATPWGGLLLRDAKGNFYGTTMGGGSSGKGTVWQLTK
jgi:uncharacterized repeat protein (TIGR03803 family)